MKSAAKTVKAAVSPPAAARIAAFESILVLITVTEFWLMAFDGWTRGDPLRISSVAVATLCGAATQIGRFRAAAFLGLSLSLAFANWSAFPTTGNHRYLEMVLCAACALLDPARKEEHQLLVRSIRWITCVVLFYAGLQKLIHGYYTNGVMPAFLLHEPRFGPIFGLFLSQAEAQRILSYNGMEGAGPYLVSSPLFLLVSNSVWFIEIVLAFTLAVPRLRMLSVLSGIAFLVAVEVAAREISFGLLFINLLLMFLAGDVNRRCVPYVAAVCIVMLLMAAGFLPAVELH